MWMEGDTLMFYYYNGDNEAEKAELSAPACDTKSLPKIEKLTNFDVDKYPDWSYLWKAKRTEPR